LSFKGIVSAKAWEQCFKYERYGHFDYQCPSESRYVNFVPSDDVDDSKVVDDVHVHSEISSVVKDLLVNLGNRLLMRVMCLLRVPMT